MEWTDKNRAEGNLKVQEAGLKTACVKGGKQKTRLDRKRRDIDGREWTGKQDERQEEIWGRTRRQWTISLSMEDREYAEGRSTMRYKNSKDKTGEQRSRRETLLEESRPERSKYSDGLKGTYIHGSG